MASDLNEICERIEYCYKKITALSKLQYDYMATVFDKRQEDFDNGRRYNLYFTKKRNAVPLSLIHI